MPSKKSPNSAQLLPCPYQEQSYSGPSASYQFKGESSQEGGEGVGGLGVGGVGVGPGSLPPQKSGFGDE